MKKVIKYGLFGTAAAIGIALGRDPEQVIVVACGCILVVSLAVSKLWEKG